MTSMVLSNNGLASFSWQQVVYDQIVQRKTSELQASSDKLQESLSTSDPYFDTMSTRYATAKASISNAQIAVENGQKGSAKIRDLLTSLRGTIGHLAESDSKDMLRAKFDDTIDQINRAADLYSKAYNPIGNVDRTDWTPNTLSFTSDLMRPDVSMTGTYAGTDYYIAADDGKLWIPEPGASVITEYDSYSPSAPAASVPAGGFTSTRNGLKLKSYDAETGAIEMVVNPNHDDARTVSGTLKTGGLGVMPSWFYDLDTKEGRDAALKAISTAEAKLTGTDANLTGMSTTVKSETGKVDKLLDELKADRSKSMQQKLEANYTAQVKAQQELQVLQNTFSNLANQQANYSTMFASVKTSPLFDFTT